MRRRIFTEAERGCLETWLEDGVEDQMALTTLSRIRKGWPELAEDLDLMFRAIRRLQRLRRWRGRETGGSEFGLASRRAASGLTRVRSAPST